MGWNTGWGIKILWPLLVITVTKYDHHIENLIPHHRVIIIEQFHYKWVLYNFFLLVKLSLFLRQCFIKPRLALGSLGSWRWPWTHDSSACMSLVLGSQGTVPTIPAKDHVLYSAVKNSFYSKIITNWLGNLIFSRNDSRRCQTLKTQVLYVRRETLKTRVRWWWSKSLN